MDRARTLTELEGKDWGPPAYDSFLASECHRLRHVPLRELTVEQLRLLISQHMSLAYTVPLALEYLAADTMVSGDLYPGDLLQAVKRVPRDFWAQHPSLMAAWGRIGVHGP